MKVLVLGTVTLNGGDAAIASGQKRILEEQWPGLQLICSDSNPGPAAVYAPGETFVPSFHKALVQAAGSSRVVGRAGRFSWPLRQRLNAVMRRVVVDAARGSRDGRPSWGLLLTPGQRRLLKTMRDADLVVYCGGTSLTENYQLEPKIFDVELARILGKPYVYMQQSAGPFTDPETRRSLREQFSGADLVILRDERSRQHVLELGVPADRCAVLPDTVFALASPHLDRPAPEQTTQRVAISVREWKFFHGTDAEAGMRDYVDAVRATVTHLVRERGSHVVFVSTCQGRPEYWTDDSATAVTIVEGLPEDVRGAVEVDRQGRTPQETIDFLATFDAMVSTRMHGGILAMCAGVPTLAIAYEYKSTEVWGQLGLQAYVLDIEDASASSLVHAVDRLLDDREKVRTVLQREIPVQRDGALSAGPAIAAALAARPS